MPRNVALSRDEMLDYLRTNVYREAGTDCLLWAGAYHHGLPVVSWHGTKYSARRLLSTMLGQQSDGKWTYATCGNPQCVAEQHIGIESAKSRSLRTYASGANPRGPMRSVAIARSVANSRPTKLSLIRDAAPMRDMLARGQTYTEIAQHFGCSRKLVYKQASRWRKIGVLL